MKEAMNKMDILQRSDCFNCGAEATYTEIQNDLYEVDCVNIDCAVSQVVRVSGEEALTSPMWATNQEV